MKDNKAANNDNNSDVKVETKVKRTKANYDVIKGQVITELKKQPGLTLNGLNGIMGKKDEKDEKGLRFPVIYHAVRLLKDEGIIHGTGAKKNEGLYLDKAEAEKNKPEPKAKVQRKKDNPFVLEKLIEKKDGTTQWRAIEGGKEKAPIMEAFNAAKIVPNTVFRVVDNTGEEQKVVATNEVKAKEPAKPKSKEKKTELVKA